MCTTTGEIVGHVLLKVVLALSGSWFRLSYFHWYFRRSSDAMRAWGDVRLCSTPAFASPLN